MAAFCCKLALIAILLAVVVHARVLLQADRAVQSNHHDTVQAHNVTRKGNLKSEEYQLKYNLNILRTNTYKVFMAFESMNVQSGCGSSNQKCHCDASNMPDATDGITSSFSMTGMGTSMTWTGLEFTCNMKVQVQNVLTGTTSDRCSCSFHFNDEYGGFHDNSWDKTCPCIAGLTSRTSNGGYVEMQDIGTVIEPLS